MNVRVRVRRWVAWWFYVGVFCGGVALANIFGRSLTLSQERLLLLIGALHWLLGGIVCWAFDGLQIRQSPPKPEAPQKVRAVREKEWHPASDFLQPGMRHSLLPYSEAITRHPRRFLPDSVRASGERPPR